MDCARCNSCCSCHINPPCSHCLDHFECYECEELLHSNTHDEQVCPYCEYDHVNDKPKEKAMNELIIEMFPKTKDAVLIQKWFGSKIDNDPMIRLLLRGKEQELLEEATKMEEDDNKDANKKDV